MELERKTKEKDKEKQIQEEKEDYKKLNQQVKLAILGDGKAKLKVVEMLNPLIKYSIKRYCPIYKEYQDLYQDSVLIVLNCLENFDQKRSFPKYVKSYLKYFLLDTFRYLSQKPDMDSKDKEGEDILEKIEDNINIEKEFERKLDNIALTKAIKELPPRQRQIIVLYYLENMSIKEIGQKMAISKWTVVSAKKKALNKLRSKINDNR